MNVNAVGRCRVFAATAVFTAVASVPAEAHVKWFAPYIVGARATACFSATARQCLVLGWHRACRLSSFMATRAAEKSARANRYCSAMDRVTASALDAS